MPARFKLKYGQPERDVISKLLLNSHYSRIWPTSGPEELPMDGTVYRWAFSCWSKGNDSSSKGCVYIIMYLASLAGGKGYPWSTNVEWSTIASGLYACALCGE